MGERKKKYEYVVGWADEVLPLRGRGKPMW